MTFNPARTVPNPRTSSELISMASRMVFFMGITSDYLGHRKRDIHNYGNNVNVPFSFAYAAPASAGGHQPHLTQRNPVTAMTVLPSTRVSALQRTSEPHCGQFVSHASF